MSDEVARGARTVGRLFEERALADPDRVLYTLVHDGELDDEVIVAGDLLRSARAVASAIRGRTAPGAAVLLLHEPGRAFLETLFGCLLAGRVAVPAYPPNPARLAQTLGRLSAIARDAGTSLVATSSELSGLARGLEAAAPELAAARWIVTDDLTDAADTGDTFPGPDDVALLQYTSGSTSTPQGVVLTHANLLANLAAIDRLAHHAPGDVFVSWLPVFHDMGLVGGVLTPLYSGIHGVLIPTGAFMQRPDRWLRAIHRFRGTTSPFPNFALDLCVRHVTDEVAATLDLSCWRVACNGGEPIRASSLEAFSARFGPRGFAATAHYPAYGLAEATLIVSGHEQPTRPTLLAVEREALGQGRVVPSDAPDAQRLVGCGPPLRDHRVIVVSPTTRAVLGDDEVGEIWVSGPSVAKGYRTRGARPVVFDQRTASGDGPFLRTSDLGFLRRGELFVIGRADDVLVIRGRNHHPHDVEHTAERAHPAVRPGCVAALATDDGAALVAEIEPRALDPRTDTWAAVATALRRAVATTHGIHVASVALIAPRGLPKTPSGKLQRAATRAARASGDLPVIYASTVSRATEVPASLRTSRGAMLAAGGGRARAISDWLRALIGHAAGVPGSSIDENVALDTLGLDSAAVLDLMSIVEEDLGVRLPIELLADGPTVAELSTSLAAVL